MSKKNRNQPPTEVPSTEDYEQRATRLDQEINAREVARIRRGADASPPPYLGDVELDARLNAQEASKIVYEVEPPIPQGRGRAPRVLDHVVAGTNPYDFSPKLPADPNTGYWRGFVLKEDAFGSRYLPVALPWEVVVEHCVDLSQLNFWDTRVSHAARIENELTRDHFTLGTGIWEGKK